MNWNKYNKMLHCKIPELLNNSTVAKCWTRKWIKVNDFSGNQYSINKNIRFKAPILASDMCDYSDVYIVVNGTITADGTVIANERNKKLTFRNNALFTLYI